MWNLRIKTDEQRKKKRERQTKRQTLNYRELIVTSREVGGGAGMVKQVMQIRSALMMNTG